MSAAPQGAALDFDGRKYRQASAHQKQWGHGVIEGLALRGDETILDLGCGDGVLTAQLARLVPRGAVLGIDASPGMIATATQLTAPNLSFRCLDMAAMDFTAQFDLIFSNAALHWVPGHPRLARASLAALRPGGVIRWNFGGRGNCANLIASLREVMARPPYDGLFADFAWPWTMPGRDEYAALLDEAGFRDVHVELENRDRLFADADELIAWMDQPCLVPFLAHLPSPERAGFRTLVIDRMLSRSRHGDGRCFETFRRLDVTATTPGR